MRPLLVLLALAPFGAIFAQAPMKLTLAEAGRLAVGNNPQFSAAQFTAAAAAQVPNQYKAGLLPSLSGNLTGVGADNGSRLAAGGLNNPVVYDHLGSGLTVGQLITDFGHTANLTASSKFQAQAENQNATATREQVWLQVDASYFGALEAQAVRRVAQQTFDTRQLLLDQVAALATNKLRSELDVSFAQVALEEGRLLLQKAQNDEDAAMASLSTALGYHEFHQFQLVEQSLPVSTATNDVSEFIESALSRRPELLSLRDQRDAALRFARSERDARLPTISAVGVAGDSPIHDDRLADNYAAGGVQLSLPLFAGGLYTARQHQAELKAQADDQLLRASEDIVIRDVRIAWLNVNNALEQLRTTEQLVKHAAEAYDLAEARYKTGISSIVELSQAQLSLTSAQIANTNARYDVLIQQANLDYQTGVQH